MRVRLSKLERGSASHRARRALLAAAVLGAAGALATAALASSGSSKSYNWSNAKSAKAGGGMKALIKAAKKEGTLNVIALPTNWANYGAQLNTFHKVYGIKIHSDNPSGSSAAGRAAAMSAAEVAAAFESAAYSASPE